jgi:hypothetical protein
MPFVTDTKFELPVLDLPMLEPSDGAGTVARRHRDRREMTLSRSTWADEAFEKDEGRRNKSGRNSRHVLDVSVRSTSGSEDNG